MMGIRTTRVLRASLLVIRNGTLISLVLPETTEVQILPLAQLKPFRDIHLLKIGTIVGGVPFLLTTIAEVGRLLC
jgi:hypothetical protein